jgi:hypothetical protein
LIYAKKGLEINHMVEEVIDISENQIALKIKNPILKAQNKYNTSVFISGFRKEDVYEYESLIFIPLAEQYYHNFFEIFSRIIMLKNKGEKFKVVLVSHHKIEDGIFVSLLRNHPKAKLNSAHLKDFFEYQGIDIICVNNKDLGLIRCRNTYLFFHLFDFSDFKELNVFYYNNKKYLVSRFLNYMHKNIFLENVESLRGSLKKYQIESKSKIFISRSKAEDRKYSQEKDLESMATDLGYSIVHLEDINFLDQVKLVQSSSHIICPYGSALVNASLCTDSKILSINYTPGYYVGTYEEAFKKYRIDYTGIQINPESAILGIKDFIIKWEKNSTSTL